MPFKVLYEDERGYQWEAVFDWAEQALEQAAVGVVAYGGVAPQAVVDAETGTVVYDQAAIIAASEQIG